MEVNVGDVPQGFDMDEDNTHTYSPDVERFEDEEDEYGSGKWRRAHE
jgi:hypothetical protein